MAVPINKQKNYLCAYNIMEIEQKQDKKEGEVQSESTVQHKERKYRSKEEQLLCQVDQYYQKQLYKQYSKQSLNKYSVIPYGDKDRLELSHRFNWFKSKNQIKANQLEFSSLQISRGVAAILGMAIGDALGASTEFIPFNKEGLGIIKTGFGDIIAAIRKGLIQPRHGKIGVWTDDASMGLCLADSVLLNNYQFNPKHIRHLFILWLQHGLNNGGRPYSIGLGGNISISMEQFCHTQNDYTAKGDGFNNGNGSLMRLAPIPVAFSNDPQKAIEYSGLQSLTTHNGVQAQQCCRLMAAIIVGLINREKDVDGKKLILEICEKFQSPNDSVKCLARGLQETQDIYDNLVKSNKKFKKFNKSLKDRNWNWRDPTHTYSPCRLKQQPGYIGSYCMDALAMALHTVYYSQSFAEVVIKNADMGGDCDTVGSIAGQIAGALYGVDDGMLQLYSEMQDYAGKQSHQQVFLKAYKLAAKTRIQ